MDNQLLLKLRTQKGLDQGSVAEAAGITQPAYSRLERAERPMTQPLQTKLARALALGEQGKGEKKPHFAIAADLPDHALELIFVARTNAKAFDHLGLFRERLTAERIARVLNRDGNLPVAAVPLWLGFAGEALAKRLGRAPVEGELFVVDEANAAAIRAQAALQHGVRVLEGYAADRAHSEAAAELAATLAKARGGG
jgi:transcriptional regulator with XRE-family HTH domain